MPRYHIDTIDGTGLVRDTDGVELPDDAAARRHGLAVLPNMAQDVIPNGDRHTFTVVVRDDAKMAIYTAELTLVGRWLRSGAIGQSEKPIS